MARPPASSLNLDPLLLGVVIVIVGGWLWLARRGTQPLGSGRRSAFAVAVLLLVAVWITPLATLAQHYLLAAHLIQVLIVMGPVAAMLLLSLPPDVRIARNSVPGLIRLAVHPVVAIIALNATFIAWHISPTYDAALASWWLYDLMEASLLLVSLLFWWPIVSPCSAPGQRVSGFAKLGYIVLATIPQTFGGLLVALASHVLYAGYGDGPRLVGLDPITDQQIAGASIALVSKIALLFAFFVVFMNLLNADGDAREEDGGGGGGGGSNPRVDAPTPRPSGIPRWLDDVGDGRTTDEPAVVPRPVRVPVGSGSRPA
ncbi:MAG TPA: cytochrome c oxidase assembly protein [Candidatus Acidoferrales bacterium]|nr:cytochrome c oxidase assembly protein [Candidatus Acidoferrales bacterium]